VSARNLVVRVVLGVLPCTLAATACRDEAPTQLADGAPARASPVVLDGVSQKAIATELEVVPLARVSPGSALARCLGRLSTDTPVTKIVVRTGVLGRSVTVGTVSHRALYACDGRPAHGSGAAQWCGTAYGRVEHGHLLDPRLDLSACTDGGSRPLAFAWVEARDDARYVAVRQPGYTEVYPVRGRIPVRIASTTGVDLEGSRASFEISEHDARGQLLRAYELEASVAG
jgi:hypothetical protein